MTGPPGYSQLGLPVVGRPQVTTPAYFTDNFNHLDTEDGGASGGFIGRGWNTFEYSGGLIPATHGLIQDGRFTGTAGVAVFANHLVNGPINYLSTEILWNEASGSGGSFAGMIMSKTSDFLDDNIGIDLYRNHLTIHKTVDGVQVYPVKDFDVPELDTSVILLNRVASHEILMRVNGNTLTVMIDDVPYMSSHTDYAELVADGLFYITLVIGNYEADPEDLVMFSRATAGFIM